MASSPSSPAPVPCKDINLKFGREDKATEEYIEVLLQDIPRWDEHTEMILLNIKRPWSVYFRSKLSQLDVLSIRGCRVLTRNNNLTAHDFELQLDDTKESRKAQISGLFRLRVRSSRHRLLDLEGDLITFNSIFEAAKNNEKGLFAKAMKQDTVVSGYVYTPLSELQPGLECNIVGVVASYTHPRKTRKNDSYIVVSISDRTIPNGVINMNIFAAKEEDLPRFHRIGDIFRVHRAKVDLYSGRPSLVYQKFKSSFLCIDGREGHSTEPYGFSTENYTEVDKELVVSMRKWLLDVPLQIKPPDMTFTSLEELPKCSMKTETICKVIGVTKSVPGGRKRLVVVWDGTDIETEGNLIVVKGGDCEHGDSFPEHGAYFAIQMTGFTSETSR
eukprot:jgi/Bigna1/83968/fgenesh1_pg.119_\